MLSFTTLSSSRSAAIWSSTGAIAWQGPHHSAQKSTSTGCSLASTSCSKVCSVTAFAMSVPFYLTCRTVQTPGPEPVFPVPLRGVHRREGHRLGSIGWSRCSRRCRRGRTLKDVFQRYKALRGYHQRYQNGWDCQGLWIEVGVERSLGLNSKREIEEYGLEEFAAKCRDVVVWSSQELTNASKRLGQWMD